MTDKPGKKMALALEALRSGVPWKETRTMFSMSVLYEAVNIYLSEIMLSVDETRGKLTEKKAALSELEARLKKVNAEIAEAEEGLGQVRARRTEAEEEVKSLEVKRGAAASDLSSLVEERRKAIHSVGATEEQLRDYVAAKTGLNRFGLEIGDASAISSVFENVKKLGDPARIADTCKRIWSLEAEEKRLQESTSAWQRENAEAEEELKAAQAKIEGNKELVRSIDYISALGASTGLVGQVIEAALRSSAMHGYTTAETLAGMALDLGENYGVTRSLREEVVLLEKKRGNLERINVEVENSSRMQNGILEANQEDLQSLRWLIAAGVPNEAIVEMHNAFVKQGKDPSSFLAELNQIGGLNALLEEKKTNIRNLSAAEDQLEDSIGDKNARIASLDNQFVKAGEGYAESLEKSLTRIASATERLDPIFDELIKKHYSAIDRRAEDLTRRIDDTISKRNTALDGKLTEFNGKLGKLLSEMKGVSDLTTQAVIDASRLANLHQLAQIMSGGDPDLSTFTLRLYSILRQARKALAEKGYSRQVRILDEALEAMTKHGGQIDLQ